MVGDASARSQVRIVKLRPATMCSEPRGFDALLVARMAGHSFACFAPPFHCVLARRSFDRFLE